ncbi:MAG: OmpH family outer membrane protein [Chitinophagia bacterium]|nr:OmpH family outer membrane protein [Chitinophagia bacterium]
MKMSKGFLFGLLACLTMASAATSQTKFAYVSVDEVVQLMPEYKKAMAEMAQYDSALQINYAETLRELNRQDSIYKADSSKWSNAIRTANREKMKKLLTELQGFEGSYQQQMQQRQEELMTPVAQKATALIQEVAKAGGYGYVLRKEALLVQPDTDDLLPAIKKKLGGAAPPAPKPAGQK